MNLLKFFALICLTHVCCVSHYVETNGSAISYENLDPQVAQFLNNLAEQAGPPIYTLKPEKARKVLDDLQAPSVNSIPAEIKDIIIRGGPTKEISVRIVRPVHSKNQKLPIVLYLHGGGWILGNKNTHDRLVRKIANDAQVGIAFVNYTLSPEAHYPVAIEQAYAVLNYLAKHGNKLGLDSSRMAIVGDSVGGLMATALAKLVKDRNGPKILHQVLMYPVTDATFGTPSYKQFAEGFWLTKKAMEWFWDAYAPKSIFDRTNPSIAPLQSSIDQLRGMPPTLIFVNENDVLRDEAEAYARKLMQAGVNVTAIRMLGTIHDSALLDPLKNTAATNSMIDIASQRLHEIFNKYTGK